MTLTNSELDEKLKVLLFDFAKYVRLASIQANKNISAYYQLDNKANVDVEALINDTVAHIQLLTRELLDKQVTKARIDELERFMFNRSLNAGEIELINNRLNILKGKLKDKKF